MNITLEIPDDTLKIIIVTEDETIEHELKRPIQEGPSIDTLSLPTRPWKRLTFGDDKTIPELLSMSRDYFFKLRNFGDWTMDQIAIALGKIGDMKSFVRYAFPDSTVEEIEDVLSDPDSISNLNTEGHVRYKLYWLGVRTIDEIRNPDDLRKVINLN